MRRAVRPRREAAGLKLSSEFMKWTQKLVWTGFALQEDMPFNSAAVGDCHSDGLAPIPCEVIPRAAPSLTEIDIATDPCNDRSGLTTENEM